MNKHSITIPLPEGWVLAKEGLHVPQIGDFYLNTRRMKVIECIQGWRSQDKFPIVQREWTPPASCPSGTEFSLRAIDGCTWLVRLSHTNGGIYYVDATSAYSDFTPPPYSPYITQ